MDDKLHALQAVWTREGEVEARLADAEIMSIIRSVGADISDYKSMRTRDIGKMVSEIYSPLRVTAAAKLLPNLGCLPGFALYLTTVDEQGRAWDFDVLENPQRAMQMVKTQKPAL